MRDIVIICHNLRSTHNVGSLLRTAEGLGISKVFLTGYTPYPAMKNDARLPHLAQKIGKQINKTALDAETFVNWQHSSAIEPVLDELKRSDFKIVALEQATRAIKLPDFEPPQKLALIVGREVEGIEQEIVDAADLIIEVPMFGHKESFNVVQAAAMAMYHCRFV